LAKSRAVVVMVAAWAHIAKSSLQVIVAAKVAACQRLTLVKSSVCQVGQVVAARKPAA